MSATQERRRYNQVAAATSHAVLDTYSTSFALGTRILDPVTRAGIEAVYGMVRVADEIVDTHRGPEARRALDAMHDEVLAAMSRGWSADLVVHGFARVARYVGITRAEVDPFFESMRMDLDQQVHDRASFDRYVYGSAEVVGVMCLAVFLNATRSREDGVEPPSDFARRGARALGAALQKINFLRDLRTDHGELGRSYFPGLHDGTLSPAQLALIIDEIDRDLACAREALPALPVRARCAVAATLAVYEELLGRLAASSPHEIMTARVRVPDPVKFRVAFLAVCATVRGGS